ncbi:MAG: CDP-alcohol phosphatidyltransferase family protein [Planctomycetota bacterium]
MLPAHEQRTQTDAEVTQAEIGEEKGSARERARGRLLHSIQILPAMVTVANGLLGFAAIHFASKEALGQTSLANLEIAIWLIWAAMFADMLDGRIARMARRTSDFGGQLDSLCDVISFGVAPAVLSLRAVVMILERTDMPAGFGGIAFERVVWGIAAVYVACATLRLARFNVENEPDESAHMRFEGLPSPGAAAVVIGVLLVLIDLATRRGVGEAEWLLAIFGMILPATTLLAGLLMVSRVGYPHPVNQYIRNRSPWRTLILAVTLAVFLLVVPYLTFAGGVIVYVLWGLGRSGWSRWRAYRAGE